MLRTIILLCICAVSIAQAVPYYYYPGSYGNYDSYNYNYNDPLYDQSYYRRLYSPNYGYNYNSYGYPSTSYGYNYNNYGYPSSYYGQSGYNSGYNRYYNPSGYQNYFSYDYGKK